MPQIKRMRQSKLSRPRFWDLWMNREGFAPLADYLIRSLVLYPVCYPDPVI